MRKINIENINDIALGAAVLGSGGGGDPYIGKLIAMAAIEECGPVVLLDPEELDDDDLIVPIAMMGAPTILCEKAINGNEYKVLYETISQFYGKKIKAFMPIEAGGVNSMMPIAACARLNMPLVDADGMGRAFPELQMVTFTLGGVNATPMALTDEKGNTCIFKTISNKWTEELARAVTMSAGGSVSVSLYIVTGAILKKYGIKNILTYSEELGKSIRTIKDTEENETCEEKFLKSTKGYGLFKGKIVDVQREVKGAFNFGNVYLEGISEYKGNLAKVSFQNENLVAYVNDEIVASTPDLICLVDCETFYPVTTDALKYGKRVFVVGLPCDDLWRTTEGLELVGPKYFGYDVEYISIEDRIKRCENV